MAYGDLPLDAPCKPNKGLEGGACNRRSCQAEPALWFNHGSHSWYCDDCRNDIQFDSINLRDWTYRFEPHCGHPQFETREMMNEREARPKPEPDPCSFEALFGESPYEAMFGFKPGKPKSKSLQRMLRKAKC